MNFGSLGSCSVNVSNFNGLKMEMVKFPEEKFSMCAAVDLQLKH